MHRVAFRHIAWGTFVCLVVALVLCSGVPHRVFAQSSTGSFSFTVTPPLIQIALQPGESWSSAVQVVNQNPYDITIFVEPVIFSPGGETGQPVFMRTMPGTDEPIAHDPSVIAGWMQVPNEPIRIAREQTASIPLHITVPTDAAPGGHYAALLIGNTPPQAGTENNTISVTSSIASLIFLRVAGDVLEDGRIREFSTERMLYDTAEAFFTLRFENKGNVHLQPQGAIAIYNMFGKKRGEIYVNHVTGYGNVLPGSVREFAFTWKSDTGSWDIGRYRAEVTLGYGLESKQFAHATTYFWVLPLVPFFQVLGGFVAVLWFLGWAVRAYIRRALALEGLRTPVSTVAPMQTSNAELPGPHTPRERTAQTSVPPPVLRLETLMRPIQVGMIDLRRVGMADEHVTDISPSGGTTSVNGQTPDTVFHFGSFMRRYRYFFFFVLMCGVCWYVVSVYFTDVLTTERTFQVTEERPDGTSVELPVYK